MTQPLFPSVEVMNEATWHIEPYHQIKEYRCPEYSDGEEIRLWQGRKLDSTRVICTAAGILDSPRVVPELVRGRLS